MAVSISVAGTCRKSQEYIKKSNIPEIYVGADYKNGGLLAGVGIEMISLRPRTQSSWEDPTYDPGTNSTILTTRICKVDERITTLSYEAHVNTRIRIGLSEPKAY